MRHRIPSLDGLRAVSIGLVIFSHLAGTSHFFVSERVGSILALGDLGVRVFFVISGFLITTLLVEEMNGTSRLHLPRFYFRRTLRIFPPYYLLICGLMLLHAAGWISLRHGDLLHALTYSSNYHPDRSWNVGHTWSLSVEEQFYLLWPAALLIAGRRRALWGAAALVLLCPLIRLGLWHSFPAARSGIGHRFETVIDSIAAGCLLAGSRSWLGRFAPYQRLLVSRGFILIPSVVLLCSALHERPRVCFLFGYTVMNLGIAACIDRCLTYPAGGLGRVLNSAPLVTVGIMSYSIYLWQQLFLNRYSDALVCRFPLNLLMVGAAALLSFYGIERPSSRLRQRWEARLFAHSSAGQQSALQSDFAPTSGALEAGR